MAGSNGSVLVQISLIHDFGMELNDVTDVVKRLWVRQYLQDAIENGGSVRGINAKGQGTMPRKKIDALVDFAKGLWCKGSCLYCHSAEDGSIKSSFAKFMTG